MTVAGAPLCPPGAGRQLNLIVALVLIGTASATASGQHPDQQTESKRNSHGLIRVGPNRVIDPLQCGRGLCFELPATGLDPLERLDEFFLGFFGDVFAGGFDQILRIMQQRHQILDQFFPRPLLGFHVAKISLHNLRSLAVVISGRLPASFARRRPLP